MPNFAQGREGQTEFWQKQLLIKSNQYVIANISDDDYPPCGHYVMMSHTLGITYYLSLGHTPDHTLMPAYSSQGYYLDE